MKIHYERHPVSHERKAELRARGFKIIDARFAPADWKAEVAEEKPKRRGRPRKVEADAADD